MKKIILVSLITASTIFAASDQSVDLLNEATTGKTAGAKYAMSASKSSEIKGAGFGYYNYNKNYYKAPVKRAVVKKAPVNIHHQSAANQAPVQKAVVKQAPVYNYYKAPVKQAVVKQAPVNNYNGAPNQNSAYQVNGFSGWGNASYGYSRQVAGFNNYNYVSQNPWND